MLVKGYSFSEVYENGMHRMNEQGIKYDGDRLQLFNNDDGIIQYQSINNDDLLRFIGHQNKSLFERLEDDFEVKHHKSRKHRKSRKHHKSRKHRKSRKHHKHHKIPKSVKKYLKEYKTPRKSLTRKRSRKQITPAILKTIY